MGIVQKNILVLWYESYIRSNIIRTRIFLTIHSCVCWITYVNNGCNLIHEADPTAMAGSDHYFHTWCLYVRLSDHPHFSKYRKINQISSENSDRYRRDYGSDQRDHWWHTSLKLVTGRLTLSLQIVLPLIKWVFE